MDKSEYHRYLASREWAILREAVRQRSDGICERCTNAAIDSVHHLTYERIGNEDLNDLVGVCSRCHEFLSGKSDIDPVVIGAKAIATSRAHLEHAVKEIDEAETLLVDAFGKIDYFDYLISHLDEIRMSIVDILFPKQKKEEYQEPKI